MGESLLFKRIVINSAYCSEQRPAQTGVADTSAFRRVMVAGKEVLFPALHSFAKPDLSLFQDDNFKHKRCPG